MAVEFTEKDEGKPIVDINDARIGTVVTVEDGTAYMNLKDELLVTLKATFGIETTEHGLYPLQDEMIDRVTDDKIRLRGDHVAA